MDRISEENMARIVQCSQDFDQSNALMAHDQSIFKTPQNVVSEFASLLNEMYIDQREEEEPVVRDGVNTIYKQIELLRENIWIF